jgi:predicted GNAT superfamily acetyltransferase
MSGFGEVRDLHEEQSAREELLSLNNASAQETSLLTRANFDRMIAAACVATFIAPSAAFLLAFEQGDTYEGGHFLWFRSRFGRFLYVDRVVVAAAYRRHGLGRLLYADLFQRAGQRRHTNVVCEVNLLPPNPVSHEFHAAHGFEEVGLATLEGGGKTVRYLLRRCR